MVRFLRVQHVSVPMPAGGQERARAFYGGLLGLPEVRVPSSLRGDLLVWFKAGDDEVHLFTDDEGAGSSAQHLCLQVDDLPALLDRLSETDIEIDREPTPIQNRPRCFLRDPFGNLIELTQITGDYS